VKFDSFTVGYLARPESRPEMSDEEADAIQDAHLAYLATLHVDGALLAAGPVAAGGDGSVRGFLLFSCDRDTALDLAADDPAVRAGRFRVELFTWLVPAGAVRSGTARFPRSMAEASGDS